MSGDRAGEEYWSKLWSVSDLPRPVDPADRSVRNYLRRRFVRYFDTHLLRAPAAGGRLIEVGCARSVWPSFFASARGLRVSGLDYSPVGCEQSRAMFVRDGVNGDIVQGDLFDPPADLRGAFDYVISFGVVEHFEDTVAALRAMALLLAPGGRMYTLIPNQIGLMGQVQKRLDRRFFDIHVPLDAEALRAAHERAGLTIRDAGYFMSTNFGVLNHSMIAHGSLGARVRGLVRAGFVALSVAVWVFEDLTGLELPATRAWAPYAICVADRPETA